MGKDMVPKRIFLTKGVGKHKERLTSFELALRDAGILVPAIRPPTVPKGQARLRISLSAAHTAEDVRALCDALFAAGRALS